MDKTLIGFEQTKKKEQSGEWIKERHLLHHFFMQAPAALCILRGAEHVYEFANEPYCQIIGNRNPIGKTVREALPELEGQGFYELLDNVYNTGEPYVGKETPAVLNNGEATPTHIFINFSYQAFTDTEGKPEGILVFCYDVTDQVLARKKIEASEKEFRQLSNLLPQIVWTAKPDGYVDHYNDQWYEFTGFDKKFGDQSWLPILHPDEAQTCIDTWYASVKSGTPYQLELRFYDKKSDDFRWFLCTGVPIIDEKGTITKWVGSCTNIHEQKLQSELLESAILERTKELKEANEKLHAKNVALEKMNKQLESFAYVSSHDLQEPLRKIKVYSDLVSQKDDLDAGSKRYLNNINSSAHRMSDLINAILSYSKLAGTKDEFVDTDLNEILSAIKNDLELTIQKKKAIISSVQLPVIKAIPIQMNQLFFNIISNSLKYSDATPVIEITTNKIETSKGVEFNFLMPYTQYQRISFRDNGIGFSQNQAEKIFGIFQRLHPKQKYEGTGIGLALCKKIIDNHKGVITAESELGHGAVFHVYLPVNN